MALLLIFGSVISLFRKSLLALRIDGVYRRSVVHRKLSVGATDGKQINQHHVF